MRDLDSHGWIGIGLAATGAALIIVDIAVMIVGFVAGIGALTATIGVPALLLLIFGEYIIVQALKEDYGS